MDLTNYVMGSTEPPEEEAGNVIELKPPPYRPPSPKEQDVLRPLPHAVGPEKAVLSVVLQFPERLEALESLPKDFFYLPAHNTLVAKLVEIRSEGKEIELVSLVQRLLDDGLLDRVGGPSAVTDLYTYQPSPTHFDHHLEIVAQKHAARAAIQQANKLVEAIYDQPDEVIGTIGKVLENLKGVLDASPTVTPLLARAYAEQYDPKAKPPPDEAVMMIGQAPIAARGNLTVIQGKQKAGKSAVVSSIIGAALRGRYAAKGDTLGIEWVDEKHDGTVIHFDTEQSKSDWWGLVTRSFIRSGNMQFMSRIVSISLLPFKLAERMQVVEEILRDQAGKKGVELMVLDGVADLTASPNDEEESRELVARLMSLANKYHIAIVCIIHENPSAENGKTRGHLGSELGRKAFANLRVDKDQDSVSTLYGSDMRKRDIPKSAGICFAWNEEEKMHTVIGSSSEIERERSAKSAETKKANELAKHTALLESILADDSMPYNDLVQAIIEADGVSDSAAKKRIPKWISAGILTKNPDGNYSLP